MIPLFMHYLLLFHKCPRHPWNISSKQIKHREVQCPSLRKVFKPTVFDPTITLPSKKVPKAFRRGSSDFENSGKSKGDNYNGGRRSKHGSHSGRHSGDYRGNQRDSHPNKERNGTPKSSKQDE